MPDRDIVIKAWETVLSRDPLDVAWDLIDDTITLLKRQEPLKPFNPLSPHGGGIYFCGECKSLVGTHDKFCSQCGRAVKWNA